MKSIKIITFSRAHNYGALLQAYALQKFLNKFEKNVKILDYRNESIETVYKPLALKNKNIPRKVKAIIRYLSHFSKLNKRYNTFNDFINNKLILTESVYLKNDIEDKIEQGDIFITGSDQVWNPGIVGDLSDIYTLNFGKDNIRRISYAASVGNASLIKSNKDKFQNKISKLDFISVREEDAKNELIKFIDKPIDVVLDPTLLLNKVEWDKEIKDLNKENEKYILAYVVQADKEYVKIVNYLSEKTGLKVVHFGLKNPGYKNVLKSAYTDGPLEFVNYIKNAEYVVATSFHATVFSIIYNKKFFIIPHNKTGARVTNLLDTLKIKDRVHYNLESFKKIDYDFESDWKKVQNNLENEKTKSIDWIKKALNS